MCVCQLCISEGRPDLERRVGDGVNPAEFPLSADMCTDAARSGGNVGTSRKTSRSFSFFKRRPIILLTMTTGCVRIRRTHILHQSASAKALRFPW